MKIDFTVDKIIVYLYQNELEFDNINSLNDQIKKIIIKLIKKMHVNLFGYSKISIYNNDKYGNILEIEKIYDNHEYNLETIDLKIIVYKDVTMYLEFDNFCFNKIPKGLIIKKNKYYINVNDINNIAEYIEYGRISYLNN